MDFAKYLPLSQRRDDDESGVTTDRRSQMADLVDRAAALVHDAPGDMRAELRGRFVGEAGLDRDIDGAVEEVDLAQLSAAVRSGRKRRVADLTRALRALLMLADDVDRPAGVSPVVLGAVALHLSGAAPFDRRAAIAGHSVVAVDADWGFGTGPALAGTAEEIARFLLGLSDEPPRPPAPPVKNPS
jgi:hypothetical protein